VAVVGAALELAPVDETVVDAPVVDDPPRVVLEALVEVPPEVEVAEVDVAEVDVDDSPRVGSDCDPTPTASAPARTAPAVSPAEASVMMTAVATARRSMTD
jgi:hypothetical protein